MTGTGLLLRTFLRRDRWFVLGWVIPGTFLYYSQAVSVKGLYATQAELDRAAASMAGNAGFIAMAGPARALDTIGGQVMWQASAMGAVVAGLMSMFLVGRHTRAEEETGREELLRSGAVGRTAPMTAAVADAVLANLALGVLVAASLATYGLTVADSVAVGLGLTGCGWFFTATALVAAQLTTGPRAAYAAAGSVIAVAYVLRAVGDVGNGVVSWFSPIGWYQAMHPFSGVRWWPALLLGAGTLAALAASYQLFARRDLGAGLLAARPGPARAGAGLRSALGLAWRLHRGPVVGWALGLFLVGLAYGSMGNDVADLVGDSGAARDMLAQGNPDLVDGFYATASLMLALLASGFAISSALRPASEEERGHAEVLLATALPRWRWFAGHATMTVGGAALTLVAGGLGLAAGYAMVTGDASAPGRLTVPVLQYLAAVLVLTGLARLLLGLLPRVAVVAWAPLAWSVVVLMMGQLLRIPQLLQDLSPFEHLALVPAVDFRWQPFVALLLLAATLELAGQMTFSRRDVH